MDFHIGRHGLECAFLRLRDLTHNPPPESGRVGTHAGQGDIHVIAHPEGTGVVRCKTVEPEVEFVTGGTSLTGNGNARNCCRRTGTAADNALQQICHDPGDALLQNPGPAAVSLQNGLSVTVPDARVADRLLRLRPVIRERGVSIGHFQCRDTLRHTAKSQRRCIQIADASFRIQCGDPVFLHHVGGIGCTYLHENLVCAGIDGSPEGSPERLVSGVTAAGVLRPGCSVVGGALIIHRGAGGDVVAPAAGSLLINAVIREGVGYAFLCFFCTLFQGCGVDRQRLDGRSRLPGAGGTVIQHASLSVPAAYHRLHFTGGILDDGHGCLRLDVPLIQGVPILRDGDCPRRGYFQDSFSVFCPVFPGNNDVSAGVAGLVLLRNIEISSVDGVQLPVPEDVHRREFDTEVDGIVRLGTIDLQTFIRLDQNRSVLLHLGFIGLEGEITVRAEEVIIVVHDNGSLVTENVALSVIPDVRRYREVGAVLEFPLHCALRLLVQRRMNLHAAGIDLLQRFRMGDVIFLLQVRGYLIHNIVSEVRVLHVRIAVVRIQLTAQGSGYCLLVFLLCDVALFLHELQTQVTARHACFVVHIGVVRSPFQDILRLGGNGVALHHLHRRIGGRRLRQRGEGGHLSQAQLLHGLTEIGFRCGLDTVGIEAQGDGVHVRLCNLLLRQIVFQLHCVPRLDDLPLHTVGVHGFRQEYVPGQLLGQGTGAADTASAENRFLDRTENPNIVESVMLPECLVFQRHVGVHQILRKLVVLHVGPFGTGVELFDLLSVHIIYGRTLVQNRIDLPGVNLRRIGDGNRSIHEDAQEQDQEDQQDRQKNPLPAFHLPFRFSAAAAAASVTAALHTVPAAGLVLGLFIENRMILIFSPVLVCRHVPGSFFPDAGRKFLVRYLIFTASHFILLFLRCEQNFGWKFSL